jgi:hypothetical protein
MTRRITRSAPSKWDKAEEVLSTLDAHEWDKRLRKAMQYAKGDPLRLTSEERYSLAKMVPGTDSDGTGSWRALTQSQLDSLINMLEGWIFITYLLQERPE